MVAPLGICCHLHTNCMYYFIRQFDYDVGISLLSVAAHVICTCIYLAYGCAYYRVLPIEVQGKQACECTLEIVTYLDNYSHDILMHVIPIACKNK